MDSYSFFCHGHENIRATHDKTLEFTKEGELTERGDCIIGVKADFDSSKLKEFIKGKEKIKIVVECDGLKEEINCNVNEEFCSDNEIVIRRSDFISDRTLGTRADKTCSDLSTEIVEKCKEKSAVIKIILCAAA